MKVTALALEGVFLLQPRRHNDSRGYFSETFNARRLGDALAKRGVTVPDFVQDNESFSASAGTIRGLHLQVAPMAQVKVVRCVAGAILDVVVDLRHGSDTYGKHVSVTIDAQAGEQVFIPVGCAHGFCTLKSATCVQYKTSAYYSPDHEITIAWNDPELAIVWPTSSSDAILSDKDRSASLLSSLLTRCF